MVRYRTIDIAREAGVHVNTVRLYEQIGLISKPPRTAKGYRVFSEKHLYQTKISRLLVHGMWPGKTIRSAGMLIVYALLEWDLSLAYERARRYIETINAERERALVAVRTLENWGNRIYAASDGAAFNRKQTADIIGTTPEALRSWERKGLLKVPRKGNKREYSSVEIERLQVIYLMLQSKYKIEEIRDHLRRYDKAPTESLINGESPEKDTYISALRSHWLDICENAYQNAVKVVTLLEEIM